MVCAAGANVCFGSKADTQTPPRINESQLRHQYAIKTHTY